MTKIRELIRRLRDTSGAIDLSSIMVGVILLGIFLAVIGASVFGVIPWSQDKAAAQELDAVKTAQTVSRGMDGKYLPYEALDATKRLKQVPRIAISVNTDGTCWTAVAASATGKKFYLTDDMSSPALYEKGTSAVADCGYPLDDVADGATPGNGDSTPPGGGGGTPPDGGETIPPVTPQLTFTNDASIPASALTGTPTTVKATTAPLADGQTLQSKVQALGLTETGGMGGAEFSEHQWDFSATAITAHASNGVAKGAVTLAPDARLTIRTNNLVDWDAGTVTPVNTDVTVSGVTLSGLDSAAAHALLSNGYLEFQLSDGFIFRVAFNGQDGIVP